MDKDVYFQLKSNEVIADGCRLVGLVFSHPESGYDCFNWVKYNDITDMIDEFYSEEYY